MAFVDGIVIAIARPGSNTMQGAWYNEYEKKDALEMPGDHNA